MKTFCLFSAMAAVTLANPASLVPKVPRDAILLSRQEIHDNVLKHHPSDWIMNSTDVEEYLLANRGEYSLLPILRVTMGELIEKTPTTRFTSATSGPLSAWPPSNTMSSLLSVGRAGAASRLLGIPKPIRSRLASGQVLGAQHLLVSILASRLREGRNPS